MCWREALILACALVLASAPLASRRALSSPARLSASSSGQIVSAHALGRLPAADMRRGGALALLGRWHAWQAATRRGSGRVVCYAFTRGTSASVAWRGRGDVVLTVTERDGTPRDAVALNAGFAYPPDAAVEVMAGSARMAFYTEGRSAFARSGREAVRAFGRATQAVARSPMPHGRSVTDVFSLVGFDEAYAAISHACPAHA